MKLEKIINEDPAELVRGVSKLTLYYPVADYESAQQQTRIKSFIKRAWRAKQAPKLDPGGADELWAELEPLFERRYRLREGVVILAKIKNDKLADYKLVELEEQPKKQINWGEVYELSQWGEIEESGIRALVIALKKDVCEVYFLLGGKWIEEKEIEKEPMLRASKDSFGKYAPTRREGTYYSWGWDKQERWEETEKQWFVNEVSEKLEPLLTKLPRPKQILLFYSKAMQEQQEALSKELEQKHPKAMVLTGAENYQNQAELKRQVVLKIRQAQRRKQKQELKAVRENYPQLVTGWNQVAQAVNKQQVRTLFTTGQRKTGYVVGPELIFSHPQKNSRQVANINAWLVKKVLKNGGKIRLERGKWLREKGVAAVTYY